ncbi:hypothetical protein [Pisciglobus halotolerans]|uniref:Uncharacterized protein n=1 Tax=Pisciglobus halotolerans TaxID=745365 RepID=A0A1I3CEM1_9LACT|nr:hypothetical protein [Pisciglobus halotolerans]SFH72990.1 hypothetical protein SAMN04489868_11726 [Pisciglobus halotolerans]
MNSWIIAIILLIIAIALIVWSFFKKDSGEKIQEEFEELSLQLLQDIYHLKERVSILESELNIPSQDLPATDTIHEVIKKHVIHLYTQDVSTEDIANQTRLMEETVKQIIDEYVIASSK